jgi:hypothetical protein
VFKNSNTWPKKKKKRREKRKNNFPKTTLYTTTFFFPCMVFLFYFSSTQKKVPDLRPKLLNTKKNLPIIYKIEEKRRKENSPKFTNLWKNSYLIVNTILKQPFEIFLSEGSLQTCRYSTTPHGLLKCCFAF